MAEQTQQSTLNDIIGRIAHWLPTQGPLKDFIHHNTLHAVQHHGFHEGIAIASQIYGARSYLPLKEYQQLYRDGRITPRALEWAIDSANLTLSDTPKIRARLFSEDVTAHYPVASLTRDGIRNRWLNDIGVNLNALVHPILFRLLSHFLDQGIARWILAKPNERFWDCLRRINLESALALYPFETDEARNLLFQTPDQVIATCLQRITGDRNLYEQYLLEMLLQHPGWSGMVRLIEEDPSRIRAQRLISLKEMIAYELICEVSFLNDKLGTDWIAIAAKKPVQPALRLSAALEPKSNTVLRIWHEAMEFALHSELLQALHQQAHTAKVTAQASPPIAQAIFCIDDRECSIRRNLESVNPGIETLGAAGFFGIDFLYQGPGDAYPVSQCPANIQPKHLILESPVNKPVSKAPKSSGIKLGNLHLTTHNLISDWLFTQTLGLAYAIGLAWHVFRPGTRVPSIRRLSEVHTQTRLHLLRTIDASPSDGPLLGFSHEEMADRIENQLRLIGLTRYFAPVIVIVAHGSSSANNPHFAAYDCGACAGKPGAPNARAFAWMANNATVRAILHQRGIAIPEATRFIPALHNTSRDEMTYLEPDTEMDNQTHQHLLAFKQAMSRALERNAGERTRWFELGPQSSSDHKAHQHVKNRAASIFEPRPELNHSNNLYCIIGKRSLTRDIFMDRRAFLHSYDPASDTEGLLLAKILAAIFPVCGGINLEYLFSRIDNSIYGAGTKLPHNIMGLLGVANGVEGDLRTGLPSQMIEVHQPSRLLIVVEQSPDTIDRTLERLGTLRQWADNEWIRLVSCDPVDNTLRRYSQRQWQALNLSDAPATPSAIRSSRLTHGQTATIPVHLLLRNPR